ncbi:MAG: NAD-dependent epimerase/dehydratase family protein [Candidatus Latescibacteria bacterium]|nr:NAD-dependent epimerase/dehydratase family protein [Candidatus Latescibacterota bacterium]
MAVQKVLVTGVYGLIAGAIYSSLQAQPDKYDVYALARRRYPSDRAPQGRDLNIPDDKFYLANLADMEALEKAVAGKDIVVQLAADPRPEASWESLLESNVIGARNIFEASVRAGVKRVVFASSIMVSWGYQLEEPYKSIAEGRFADINQEDMHTVTHEWPPRPTGLYPASKVWGEALARYYADLHGISALCLRIGWVNAEDHPHKPESSAIWCSQRDIVQLTELAIGAPDSLRFDVFYGISNNRWCWVDIEHARHVLGFIPQDSAEQKLGLT